MTTPFTWLAQRVTLGPRALRWATTAALVVSILVVLGGGVVRVTGSGLGCPTWPTCEGSSVTPIPELGIHGLIEFGNRLVTVLLIFAVGWAIIAARLQAHRDLMLTRLAWSMFWLVVVNAVAGGITVWVGLNPWVVALHFVLAMGLLATATLTWHRARWRGTRGSTAPELPRVVARILLAVTAALVVVGTIVSGAGPHSGDSRDVPRIGGSQSTDVWSWVVLVHAGLAVATILLAIALYVVLRRRSDDAIVRRTTLTFLVVLVAQGGIGGVQSLIGIPAVLVALHLLGAALVWVGAIRVLLDVEPELFALQPLPESSASARQRL
ncbi:MAG TPA: COX15/CtaA family protein [Pseudolysinimonas sp.]|nr:COX15/CtaA family protein [Pseudolysinimonas sp.]